MQSTDTTKIRRSKRPTRRSAKDDTHKFVDADSSDSPTSDVEDLSPEKVCRDEAKSEDGSDSDYDDSVTRASMIDQDVIEQLRLITNNFELRYKDIRNNDKLQSQLLKKLSV